LKFNTKWPEYNGNTQASPSSRQCSSPKPSGFPDASIDLLHIDGTHTYDDVKADFESWLPKLSPNGIVLLHDVILRDRGFGVWKLWEEIAREDNSFLFEFGYGLGVWKKQPVGSSDSFLVRRLLAQTRLKGAISMNITPAQLQRSHSGKA